MMNKSIWYRIAGILMTPYYMLLAGSYSILYVLSQGEEYKEMIHRHIIELWDEWTMLMKGDSINATS